MAGHEEPFGGDEDGSTMKGAIVMCMLLLSLAYLPCYGQQATGSFLLSGGMDLARTDAPGVIRRYQLGAELNYFYLHSLSFLGGYEINYNRPNQVTLGSRFYPVEPLFVRVRGLVGKDSDVALGAGYSHNISYRLRVEGMLDYYAVSSVFGLRLGIAFLIN